jgi:hypothetical protein
VSKAAKAVLAVLVLAGAAAGISYATNAVTRTATSTVQACANGTNGDLRLVSGPGDCRTTETAVSWSVVGPAGTPGQDGTNGTNGTNGKDGANGVSPTVAQLAAGDSNCQTGGASITDAAGNVAYVCNGAKGEPGANGTPFSGVFQSPNGLFSLDVADGGITIEGPTATLSIDAGSLKAESAATMKLQASQLELDAGITTIGSGSCAPPLRTADALFVQVPFQAGGVYPVTLGSPAVSDVCIG